MTNKTAIFFLGGRVSGDISVNMLRFLSPILANSLVRSPVSGGRVSGDISVNMVPYFKPHPFK